MLHYNGKVQIDDCSMAVYVTWLSEADQGKSLQFKTKQ